MTCVQVPRAVPMSQALHASVQAWLQQTPSTQCCDAHSDDCEQGDPLALGPHDPPVQLFGATHCVLELHDVKQAVPPLQAYGAHATGVDGRHWPRPSHVGAAVAVPALQLAVPHVIPASRSRQPRLPSQVPSRSHDSGGSVAHVG